MRSLGAKIPAIILGAGLVGSPLFLWHLKGQNRNENEAVAALRTIAGVEQSWRASDRDGNRVNDYWTGDVSGLRYFDVLTFEVEGTVPVYADLLPAGIADADANPLFAQVPAPVPHQGYLFIAMESDASERPPISYKSDWTFAMTPRKGRQPLPSRKLNSHDRFGFCAFPAHSRGRWTFIVNQSFNVYRRKTDGHPVLAWPSDSERAAHWEEIAEP